MRIRTLLAGTFDDDSGWDGVGFMSGDGVDLGVSDPVIEPGTYGTNLSFTASNPSEGVVEYATWHCVFRSGGSIVGGEHSGISDAIVPDGSVRVDTSLSVDGLTADEVICRAHA